MNTDEARALLLDRANRIRTIGGKVVIGLSLDDARSIAVLLPVEKVGERAPGVVEPPVVVEPTPEREKVVDTESGPVKVPQKKAAKKKKDKKRRKGR